MSASALDVSGELTFPSEICFSLSNGILDAEESLAKKLGWKFKIFLGLRTYIRVQTLHVCIKI